MPKILRRSLHQDLHKLSSVVLVESFDSQFALAAQIWSLFAFPRKAKCWATIKGPSGIQFIIIKFSKFPLESSSAQRSKNSKAQRKSLLNLPISQSCDWQLMVWSFGVHFIFSSLSFERQSAEVRFKNIQPLPRDITSLYSTLITVGLKTSVANLLGCFALWIGIWNVTWNEDFSQWADFMPYHYSNKP